MSEGVRKVNEYIVKPGRSLVINDSTIPFGQIPDGSLYIDPISGSMKVKYTGGTTWANLNASNILTANSVDTATVKDGAVTDAKLATDSVLTAKIKDLNVTAAKIADGAISAAKLGAAAVETAKIKDAAITVAKLGTAAVETVKIKDAAVTDIKLATDSVTTTKIKDLNITTAKYADKSVTTAKIADKSITRLKLDDELIGILDGGFKIHISPLPPLVPSANIFWIGPDEYIQQ